jgi:hypothetical protein
MAAHPPHPTPLPHATEIQISITQQSDGASGMTPPSPEWLRVWPHVLDTAVLQSPALQTPAPKNNAWQLLSRRTVGAPVSMAASQ